MKVKRSIVDALIEVQAGSKNKYEFDERRRLLRLDRVLHTSLTYPANYGCVEETLAEDGDALDILVWTQTPLVPSCLVRARVFGVLKMQDEKGIDHKLLAVADKDPFYSDFNDLSDFPSGSLREVEQFFTEYKKLEGEDVKVFELEDRESANVIIGESIRRYWENFRDISG